MYGRKDGVWILCGVNKNPFTLHDIFLLREYDIEKVVKEKQQSAAFIFLCLVLVGSSNKHACVGKKTKIHFFHL